MNKRANGDKANEDIHRRLRVSSIITSTSQLPTPGPPLLERDGSTRFWRVCIPDFEGVPGVDAGGAGVENSPLIDEVGNKAFTFTGFLPTALADGRVALTVCGSVMMALTIVCFVLLGPEVRNKEIAEMYTDAERSSTQSRSSL
ncbi:hypothetical protein PHLCEN_2v11568 [Hermanssonia centrifuga]|uniref:Uncharacterized protein n=1 Tax=Hermanssonia centrifuga TaxID=98765 RepID=A0A2R6NJL0_9APHY|nr:hypothetical protein PHLCEN_2v11568 [Hermanssonia centrifuga]